MFQIGSIFAGVDSVSILFLLLVKFFRLTKDLGLSIEVEREFNEFINDISMSRKFSMLDEVLFRTTLEDIVLNSKDIEITIKKKRKVIVLVEYKKASYYKVVSNVDIER